MAAACRTPNSDNVVAIVVGLVHTTRPTAPLPKVASSSDNDTDEILAIFYVDTKTKKASASSFARYSATAISKIMQLFSLVYALSDKRVLKEGDREQEVAIEAFTLLVHVCI